MASRKETLLAAAATLFRERGYDGVGMQEIGAAAGIVGSGVYRHFPSKQSLLVALTDRHLDDLLAGARAIREEALPPLHALEALVDLHLDFAFAREGLIAVYLGEERSLSDPDRKRARRKQRAYLDEWVDQLTMLDPLLDRQQGHVIVQAVVSLLQSVTWQRPSLPRAEVEPTLRQLALAALHTMEGQPA